MWAGVIDFVEGARTIAISGHTNPDGDALGSVLGLGASIRRSFPTSASTFCLPTMAPSRAYTAFCPCRGAGAAVRHAEAYDLFISVDVPTLERLEDSAAVAKQARGRVVIDHHPSREEFGDVTVRVTSAAATAVLVYELLDAAGWPCTPDIASCLLTGLMTDTGRFQYQNANPSAFACASRLVDAGAQPARIALEVYQSQRIEYLHLESIVMSRIETHACGRVAYSYAFASDLVECGVKPAECDGLVDIVRQVDGSELCLFLRESEPGVVRGNFVRRASSTSPESPSNSAAGGTPRQRDSPSMERLPRLPRRCSPSWRRFSLRARHTKHDQGDGREMRMPLAYT